VNDDATERPDATMRERVPESRWKFRLLLGADRWVLAALVLGTVFCALVVAGIALPTPVRTLLTHGDPLETLYEALVGSTITGVTVVVTLSQLVLSQEQGPAGDQRERMAGATAVREDVADVVNEPVSPARPSAFVRALVAFTDRRAGDLREAVGDVEDEALRERVEAYAERVEENADAVSASLEGAQFGEFDVVSAALDYNYSWKLYAARRLRAAHGDALPEAATAALDDLAEALSLFGAAREHVKTLYFQWELADLSRTVLYASVPAITVATGALLLFDPAYVAEGWLALVVAAATVCVALLPFAVLLAHVLRIVTVTKRTLSVGPFVLRETDREFDWHDGSASGERQRAGGD